MALRIIFSVIVLLIARAASGEVPALVAPSDGQEVFGTVKPGSCGGGKGELISLDISGCNGGTASCFAFEDSTKAFSISFMPESSVNTITVRAVGKSGGETRQLALRSEERFLEGNQTAIITAYLKFPKNSMDFEDHDVEFSVYSNNGLEACGTYKFVGVQWEQPYMGNAIGEACDAMGLPCNFANSICSEGMSCACAREYLAEEGVCKKGLSWSCVVDEDCGALAECKTVIGGQVCGCSAGSFVEFNRCVRNEQTELGGACEHAFKPCDFPRSECNLDRTCECDSNSVANNDSTGCLAQPLKTCASDSECVGDSTCVDYDENEKWCRCNPGYVPETGKCLLVNGGTTNGAACTRPDNDCAFDNSWCFGNLTCGCRAGWVFNGQACELPSGAECSSSADCGLNSYCGRDSEGKDFCACLEDYASSASGVCMRILGGGVGENCSAVDLGCDFPNSICTADLKCACNERSVWQYSQCRVQAGKICQRSADCVADATCADIGSNGNGICKCTVDFMQSSEGLCSASALVKCSSALFLFVVLLGLFNEKRW